MFSLFKRPEEEIAVVFDIGNGSVGAALVKFSDRRIPHVLYTHREPLTFLPHTNSKRLLDTMLKLLKTITEHLQKEGISHLYRTLFGIPTIQHVFCFYTSPWYVSETKILKVEKDKPFVITEDFITGLIEKERSDFSAVLKGNEYEISFGENVKLLEQKIIHTKLNGYEISEPIGKKVRELEVTVFMSYMSENIRTKTEEVLHKAFHFRNIQHFSYALASWDAVRDMFPDNHSFLFFDITGETTDISITRKGVLLGTVSFPIGRSDLIRHAVEELSVPPEVALSFLLMHATGSADETFSAKIKKVIDSAGEVWFQTLTEVLSRLSKEYHIPRRVYVTVDNDLSGCFLDLLKRDMPLELNLPHRTFDVTFLNAEKASVFADFELKTIQDPFLALESIFLNKLV